MTMKPERMSDDKFMEPSEQFVQEQERRQALLNLPIHEEVLAVHNAIVKAAQKTATSEDDVRIAEIRKFIDNFPEFVVKMTNELERWKKEHATYRDSESPEDFWYSIP